MKEGAKIFLGVLFGPVLLGIGGFLLGVAVQILMVAYFIQELRRKNDGF